MAGEGREIAAVEATIRIADAAAFRVMLVELSALVSDMEAAGDPFAPRLRAALERFADAPLLGGPDDGRPA